MKIKAKLLLSFSTLLLLFLFISLAILMGIRLLTTANHKTDLVLMSKVEMLQARRDEKDFFLRLDAKYITENKRAVKAVDALLDELYIYEKGNKKIIEDLDVAVKSLTSYDAVFEEVSNMVVERGLDENSGLRGSLRGATHKVEDFLVGQSSRIKISLLTVRRQEKDYLLRGDDIYIERLENELNSLRALVREDIKDITLRGNILEYIDIYEADFARLYELDQNIKIKEQEFRKNVHDLEEALIILDKDVMEEVTTAKRIIIIFIILSLIIIFIIGITISLILSNSLSRGIALINNYFMTLAQSDLTIEIESSLLMRKDEVGDMGRSLSLVLDTFNTLIREIQFTSNGIKTGSQQIADSAQSLSHSAFDLASSVEEMSASIEEMETTIEQNAENASAGEKLATTTSTHAREGGEAVNKTVESMNHIATNIQVITEIANNTNMLALNAAIEAARAGKQGEGFSVVAAEVRKLAERTLKAAQEITQLTSTGLEITDKAGAIISMIVPNIIKTADMVQEINTASKEQKSGITQISNAAGQQEKVSQLLSASSEELASTCKEMDNQVYNLSELINNFKVRD